MTYTEQHITVGILVATALAIAIIFFVTQAFDLSARLQRRLHELSTEKHSHLHWSWGCTSAAVHHSLSNCMGRITYANT